MPTGVDLKVGACSLDRSRLADRVLVAVPGVAGRRKTATNTRLRSTVLSRDAMVRTEVAVALDDTAGSQAPRAQLKVAAVGRGLLVERLVFVVAAVVVAGCREAKADYCVPAAARKADSAQQEEARSRFGTQGTLAHRTHCHRKGSPSSLAGALEAPEDVVHSHTAVGAVAPVS